MKNNKGKHIRKKKNKIFRLVTVVLIFTLLFSISYIVYELYCNYISRKDKEELSNIMTNIQTNVEPETNTNNAKTEKMLKVEELHKQNADIVGWLQIEGTNIDYPVLQTNDNNFYLSHNYKKDYSKSGSLFLDKDFDLQKPSTNYLIYGHRNTNGLMFEDLINYKKESYYKEHPIIKFTTLNEDCEYEIVSVFLSRVYYKSEKNVFRYYYFINAENEEEYNYYITNCKEASLYDTGKNASYGDQLLTLSTCEYSQNDGRLAVVARKIEK